MKTQMLPFDFAAAAARMQLQGALPKAAAAQALTGTKPVQGPQGSFSVAFSQALQDVSKVQNESSELQKQVQLDNPDVSLEETMLAMQKAQIGFQSVLHVRNRFVQAYTDIMNMQV